MKIKKISCLNCRFRKKDEFGYWGYCQKFYDETKQYYFGAIFGTGSCEFFIKKWYKFWI